MSALPTLMSKIDLDNTKFEKGINEASSMMDKLNKKMQKVSASMKASFDKMEAIGKKSAVAFGAITAAITGLAKAAGNAEAVMKKLEIATGSNQKAFEILLAASQKLREKTKGMYGLTDLKNALGNAYAMGKNYELTAEQISNIVERAADLGAIYRKDLPDATERLMAAMRGEAEAAEALGLSLSQTAVEHWMLENGIKGTLATMSLAEQAQVRYRMLMDKTKDTVGAAAEMSNTFNGAWQRLVNTFKEVAEQTGPSFLQPLTDAMNKITSFLEIVNRSPALQQMIADFLKLGLVIAGLGTIIGIMGKMGNLALMILVNGFTLLTNPVFLAAVAIGIVVANLDNLAAAWDGVKAVWNAADPSKIAEDWEALKNALASGDWKGTIQGGVTLMFSGLKVLWEGISEAAGDTWETFKSKLPQDFAQKASEMKSLMAQGTWFEGLKTFGSMALDVIWAGIQAKNQIITDIEGWIRGKITEQLGLSEEEANELGTFGVYAKGALELVKITWDTVIKLTEGLLSTVASWLNEHLELDMPDPVTIQESLKVIGKAGMELFDVMWKGAVKVTKKVFVDVGTYLNNHLVLGMDNPVNIREALEVIGRGTLKLLDVAWSSAVEITEKVLTDIATKINKGLNLEMTDPVTIPEALKVIGQGFLEIINWDWNGIVSGLAIAHNKITSKLDKAINGTKKDSYTLSETFEIIGSGLLNLIDWFWTGIQYGAQALGNVFDWLADRVREGLGLPLDGNTVADLGDVNVIVAGVLKIVDDAFTFAADVLSNFNKLISDAIKGLKVDTQSKIIPVAPELAPTWENTAGLFKLPHGLSDSLKNLGSGAAALIEEGFKASLNLMKLIREAVKNLAVRATGSEAAGNIAGQIPIAFVAYWVADKLAEFGDTLITTFKNLGFKRALGEAGFVLAVYATIERFTQSDNLANSLREALTAGAIGTVVGLTSGSFGAGYVAYTVALYLIPELAEFKTKDQVKRLQNNMQAGLWSGMEENPAGGPLEDWIRNLVSDMPTISDWYDKELKAFNQKEDNFVNNFLRLGTNLGVAAVGGIVKAFKNLWQWIRDALDASWDKMVQIGKDIGEKIKNGIETALKALNPFNWFNREDGVPTNKLQEKVDGVKEEISNMPVWDEFGALYDAIQNFKSRNLFKNFGSNLFTPIGNEPVPVEIMNPMEGVEGINFNTDNDKQYQINMEGSMLMNMMQNLFRTANLQTDAGSPVSNDIRLAANNIETVGRTLVDGFSTIGNRLGEIFSLENFQKTTDGSEQVKDGLVAFSEKLEKPLNESASFMEKLNSTMQEKLGETDSAMLGLIRDLFSMMTGLVQSLAQNNSLLQDEFGKLNADLGKESANLQQKVGEVTNAVNNTGLKSAQNTATSPVAGEIQPMEGLYQDKFDTSTNAASEKLGELTDATDETTNALDSFESKIMTTLSGIAETLNPLNIVAGWLGSLQSGLQGLISAIDPIAAIFRGINKALAPVLERLMKPLEHLGFLIGKALIPVIEMLIPVFTGLAYIVAGIWNAFASLLNFLLGWLGVAIPMINFGESWEEEQEHSDEMTNTAGWHQPINNTFNVTFTGNTLLDTDDEAMELLANKFLQYCREHDIEVVT